MGSAPLGEVLGDWRRYALDDSIYLPVGSEPLLDVMVTVLPFDRQRHRIVEGLRYLVGIEQIRDVIEGLEGQLGRAATPDERLRAVVHSVRHDAFIDPHDLESK